MSKFIDVFSKDDIETRGKSRAKRPDVVERLYNEVICEVRKQYRSGKSKAELRSLMFADRVCDQRRIAQLLGMLDAVFEKPAVEIELENNQSPSDSDDRLRITVKFS